MHLLSDRLGEQVRRDFGAVAWLRHPAPRTVSAHCVALFNELHNVVDEVRRLTGLEHELSTIPRRPVFKLPTVHSGLGGGMGGGGGGGRGGDMLGGVADGNEPGIRLNIERMFSQKLKLYQVGA